MKILQFTPRPGLKAPDKAGGKVSRPAAGEASFAACLPPTGSGVKEPAGAVFLENRRALCLPPAIDLGRAGRLLGRLEDDIRAASPESLRRVHNLEGLVCLYRKTSDV